jgi:hypothetical protein
VRAWADGLEAETFVGSSGRVFPKALKASPLLRSWLGRLASLGVEMRLRHRWTGFGPDNALRFETPGGPVEAMAGATILAMGGASWPRLGSDASFFVILEREGVAIAPLQPANMGFEVAWSETFRKRFAGQPLKRIRIAHGDRPVMGEAMITAHGIEGGAIYALADTLRTGREQSGTAEILIDLRPDLSAGRLTERLARSRAKESLSNRLRKAAGLSPVAIGLLRETIGGPLPAEAASLATAIKSVRLTLGPPFGLARAISTAGGVLHDNLDERLMLRKRPGVFLAGEMLDWEAPTGGYLLQACFSTGAAAAEGAMAWLAESGNTIAAGAAAPEG